ncbi:MAG: M23 family metallopeptidase [Polyangiaceae bacterium]|nr:M23 family metallopeptidase [Polyangiaceae bacterium]
MSAGGSGGSKVRVGSVVLAVLAALLWGVGALSGLLFQVLTVLILLSILVGGISRLVAWRRGTLATGWWREPPPTARRYWIVFAIRLAFIAAWVSLAWGAVGLLAWFGADALLQIRIFVGAVIAVWLLLSLFPKRETSPVWTSTMLGAAAVVAGFFALRLLPQPDPVELGAPIAGEVIVGQGGRSPVDNHHWIVTSQRHALDLLVVENGTVMVDGVEDGPRATAGFGKPILAPLDGTVVDVSDGASDEELDPKKPWGNHVVIDDGKGHFVAVAHLKQGSVRVAAGEVVKAGAPIGELGNSGNSSMPHLHIQVQDRATLDGSARTFPMRFVSVEGAEAQGPLARGDHVTF